MNKHTNWDSGRKWIKKKSQIQLYQSVFAYKWAVRVGRLIIMNMNTIGQKRIYQYNNFYYKLRRVYVTFRLIIFFFYFIFILSVGLIHFYFEKKRKARSWINCKRREGRKRGRKKEGKKFAFQVIIIFILFPFSYLLSNWWSFVVVVSVVAIVFAELSFYSHSATDFLYQNVLHAHPSMLAMVSFGDFSCLLHGIQYEYGQWCSSKVHNWWTLSIKHFK